MENLSVLENKIVQKEYDIINAEFKRATDIINKVISNYGGKFSANGDFKASLFDVKYFSGYSIENAHFGVGKMPESFLKAVKEKAISNFMENIENLNDITSEL